MRKLSVTILCTAVTLGLAACGTDSTREVSAGQSPDPGAEAATTSSTAYEEKPCERGRVAGLLAYVSPNQLSQGIHAAVVGTIEKVEGPFYDEGMDERLGIFRQRWTAALHLRIDEVVFETDELDLTAGDIVAPITAADHGCGLAGVASALRFEPNPGVRKVWFLEWFDLPRFANGGRPERVISVSSTHAVETHDGQVVLSDSDVTMERLAARIIEERQAGRDYTRNHRGWDE